MKFGPRATSVAILAAAAVALTGCSASSGGKANGGPAVDELSIASLANILSFDPAQAHLGHQMPLYQAAYDTLILREPDGSFSPMLATEWKYNDDQTVLTLDLRDDVTFSDGEKFDAEAAKANLDHFKSANGPDAAQVGSISAVDVVDEDTIDITLSAADPALEYYLTQAPGLMGSPKALGTEEIKTVPVGSGPYVLDAKSSVNGSQFVYTANKDYWNKDLQKFAKVNIKVLTDITARTNAVVSGQVNAALLDAKNGKQAEGAGLEEVSYPVDWNGLFLFDRDGQNTPALADVRVRQAINYAFDRATMLEQLSLGHGEVTAQIFGKTTDAYIPELDEEYAYDPEKAKALLADAGYADGFDLTLPILPGTEAIMAMVQQQLADVGITVKQEAVPQANYVTDLQAAKYSAAWFSVFQGEPWVAIKQAIGPQAAYNPFKTTTPELQEAIDAVQTGGDKSGELAKKVNQYVTDEAWFAPWYRIDQMFYVDSTKITVEPQTQQAVPSIYNYAPAS
jgi:peptide/nickel transport system substrate-binding protein